MYNVYIELVTKYGREQMMSQWLKSADRQETREKDGFLPQ